MLSVRCASLFSYFISLLILPTSSRNDGIIRHSIPRLLEQQIKIDIRFVMFHSRRDATRIIGMQFGRKGVNFLHDFVRALRNDQNWRIIDIQAQHVDNVRIEHVTVTDDQCGIELFTAMPAALVFPEKAEEDVIPRCVADVESSGGAAPQGFEKDSEGRGDEVQVSDSVVPEGVGLAGKEGSAKEPFHIGQGGTAQEGSIGDAAE